MNSNLKTGLLVGATLVTLATGAQAVDVCTGASGGGSVSVTASGTGFIVTGFSLQCSRNVYLGYEEDTVQVGVCSVSSKGDTQYGGSSAGGGITSNSSVTSATGVTATTAGC